MACASTVAVVVPSPATSEVLLATSLTICAPMFSSASFSSISFATVTPSLVMVGAPNGRPRMTLRPRGPSVTLTALARLLTPRRIPCREALPYTIRLAMSCLVVLSLVRRLRDHDRRSTPRTRRQPPVAPRPAPPPPAGGAARQSRGIPVLPASNAPPGAARLERALRQRRRRVT